MPSPAAKQPGVAEMRRGGDARYTYFKFHDVILLVFLGQIFENFFKQNVTALNVRILKVRENLCKINLKWAQYHKYSMRYAFSKLRNFYFGEELH